MNHLLNLVQVVGLSPGLFSAKEPIPGQVHVLHGSRVMNCLYKSVPDYGGVTGLFPVSLTLQEDDATAAVVISFASGSRALTTGLAVHTSPLTFGLRATLVSHCYVRTSLMQANAVYQDWSVTQVTPSQTSRKAQDWMQRRRL